MAKRPSKPVAKKSTIRVKSYSEVAANANAFIFQNAHDRYNFTFKKQTKEKLVAYGPWLAGLLLLILAPEFLVLAKDATFISFSGFIEQVLFSRTSWVLLSVLFINCLVLVAALEDIFNKTHRGWKLIYGALLINIVYVLYQLCAQITQPAAPILALLGFLFCLFTLLDIRKYYK